MSRWKVEWENEIDNAKTPLEAAEECKDDIANGDGLCFTVTDLKTGKKYSVDLNENEGDKTVEMSDD